MDKMLFHIFTFHALALVAATSPLATPGDYFYVAPKTTNICGRVMGENGDYGIVRYEDVAFINEAWAERLALAGYAVPTNTLPAGPLVKGGLDRLANTGDYLEWSSNTTCVVTNAGGLLPALAEASGGKMTNIWCESEWPAPRKLVTMRAVTNNYATLKRMNCLVPGVYVSSTNVATAIEGGYEEVWSAGGGRQTYPYASTNTESLAQFYLSEAGGGSNDRDSYGNRDESMWARMTTGAGTVRFEFDVADTNAWLRGQQSPKVVREARAWALLRPWAFESDTATDTDTWTNATVLVDLGEARWAGVTANGRLAYEVDVDVRELYATCVASAPWLPTLAAVANAARVPPLDGQTGSRYRNKSVSMDGVAGLVLRLKPVASLQGW